MSLAASASMPDSSSLPQPGLGALGMTDAPFLAPPFPFGGGLGAAEAIPRVAPRQGHARPTASAREDLYRLNERAAAGTLFEEA